MKRIVLIFLFILTIFTCFILNEDKTLASVGNTINSSHIFDIKEINHSNQYVMLGDKGIYVIDQWEIIQEFPINIPDTSIDAKIEVGNDGFLVILVDNALNQTESIIAYSFSEGEIWTYTPTMESSDICINDNKACTYDVAIHDYEVHEGFLYIAAGYKLQKINLAKGTVEKEFINTNDIWSVAVLENNEIAIASQPSMVKFINKDSFKMTDDLKVAKDLNIGFANKIKRNVWDLFDLNDHLYAATEDGYVYMIDTESKSITEEQQIFDADTEYIKDYYQSDDFDFDKVRNNVSFGNIKYWGGDPGFFVVYNFNFYETKEQIKTKYAYFTDNFAYFEPSPNESYLTSTDDYMIVKDSSSGHFGAWLYDKGYGMSYQLPLQPNTELFPFNNGLFLFDKTGEIRYYFENSGMFYRFILRKDLETVQYDDYLMILNKSADQDVVGYSVINETGNLISSDFTYHGNFPIIEVHENYLYAGRYERLINFYGEGHDRYVINFQMVDLTKPNEVRYADFFLDDPQMDTTYYLKDVKPFRDMNDDGILELLVAYTYKIDNQNYYKLMVYDIVSDQFQGDEVSGIPVDSDFDVVNYDLLHVSTDTVDLIGSTYDRNTKKYIDHFYKFNSENLTEYHIISVPREKFNVDSTHISLYDTVDLNSDSYVDYIYYIKANPNTNNERQSILIVDGNDHSYEAINDKDFYKIVDIEDINQDDIKEIITVSTKEPEKNPYDMGDTGSEFTNNEIKVLNYTNEITSLYDFTFTSKTINYETLSSDDVVSLFDMNNDQYKDLIFFDYDAFGNINMNVNDIKNNQTERIPVGFIGVVEEDITDEQSRDYVSNIEQVEANDSHYFMIKIPEENNEKMYFVNALDHHIYFEFNDEIPFFKGLAVVEHLDFYELINPFTLDVSKELTKNNNTYEFKINDIKNIRQINVMMNGQYLTSVKNADQFEVTLSEGENSIIIQVITDNDVMYYYSDSIKVNGVNSYRIIASVAIVVILSGLIGFKYAVGKIYYKVSVK